MPVVNGHTEQDLFDYALTYPKPAVRPIQSGIASTLMPLPRGCFFVLTTPLFLYFYNYLSSTKRPIRFYLFLPTFVVCNFKFATTSTFTLTNYTNRSRRKCKRMTLMTFTILMILRPCLISVEFNIV